MKNLRRSRYQHLIPPPHLVRRVISLLVRPTLFARIKKKKRGKARVCKHSFLLDKLEIISVASENVT